MANIRKQQPNDYIKELFNEEFEAEQEDTKHEGDGQRPKKQPDGPESDRQKS